MKAACCPARLTKENRNGKLNEGTSSQPPDRLENRARRAPRCCTSRFILTGASRGFAENPTRPTAVLPPQALRTPTTVTARCFPAPFAPSGRPQPVPMATAAPPRGRAQRRPRPLPRRRRCAPGPAPCSPLPPCPASALACSDGSGRRPGGLLGPADLHPGVVRGELRRLLLHRRVL